MNDLPTSHTSLAGHSLTDPFGRKITYLRVSVTDRCNLRCVYCMPLQGVQFVPRCEILTLEEIKEVVRVGVSLGIHSVRLTGGEPLVREGIVALVKMISQIPGVEDLSMTTNGVLLSRTANHLARAGLRRINISLDTLRSDRFQEITRFGKVEDVFSGIDAAMKAGLSPIKLNTVVMRGVNDDEILDIARLSLDKPLHIRFIELMPIGDYFHPERVVSAAEIFKRLQTLGPLKGVRGLRGCGPARSWMWEGALGTVGIIGAVTQAFCAQCNRLRLTARGALRPCLDHEKDIDLKVALRPSVNREKLAALFQEAVRIKPESHTMAGREVGLPHSCMAGVGG